VIVGTGIDVVLVERFAVALGRYRFGNADRRRSLPGAARRDRLYVMTTVQPRTRVPIRQLQRNASELVKRARAGEQIDITNHGTLVAHLTPPDPEEELIQQLIDRGLVDPAKTAPGGLSGWRPPPFRPGEDTGSLCEALIEMRNEETR